MTDYERDQELSRIRSELRDMSQRLGAVEGTVQKIWNAISTEPGGQAGVLEVQREQGRELADHGSRIVSLEFGQKLADAADGNLAKKTWWELGKGFLTALAGAAAGWLASGVRPPGP